MAETIGGICIWSPMNFGRFLVQLLERHRRDGQGSGHFAVGIVAVRGFAEFDRAFINLVVAHQFFGQFRAAAQHNDEQAGGVRVQRAAMADFLDLKAAADGVHDIVRGRAGGFVNENGAVEGGKFLHEKLFRGVQRAV